MSQALDKARAISALLDEYGITNESLETFIKEASELPSSKNLNDYNELVDAYNAASGYDAKKEAAEDLIAFYDSHAEELSAKQSEINKLKSVVEDNEKLQTLYIELDTAIDEVDSYEDNEL